MKTPAPYGYDHYLVGCWVEEGKSDVDDGNYIRVMQLLSNGKYLLAVYSYDDTSGDWRILEYGNWYSEESGFIFFDEETFGNYTLVDKDTLVFEHKENPATFKRYEG